MYTIVLSSSLCVYIYLAKVMLQTCMMMVFACYRSDFIYDLFEHMSLSTDQGQSTGFSRAQKKGAKKKATVSSQFKVDCISMCKVRNVIPLIRTHCIH